MFTDAHLSKLFNTPGMSMKSLSHFFSDKRLSSPTSIMGSTDATRQFGDCEEYPQELAEVCYYNNF